MGIPIPTAILPLSRPAAGLLPAGWAVPRALMPVHDAPLLQFALEEAAAAGVRRLVVVTQGADPAIEEYLRPGRPQAPSRSSRAPGVSEHMARFPCDLAMDIRILRLDAPWSLGRAVLHARTQVLPGPVAVLRPEDLIVGRPCAVELGEAWTVVGGAHLLAVAPASPAEPALGGFLRPEGPTGGRIIRASGFIRDSVRGASTLAVVGRYLLDERIFDDLAAQPPAAEGSLSLADAIAEGAIDIGLFGMRLSGPRFDCGTPGGLLGASAFRARNARTPGVMRETG